MKNAQSQTLVQMKVTQKDLLVALVRVLSIRITTMKINNLLSTKRSLLYIFFILLREETVQSFKLKRKI